VSGVEDVLLLKIVQIVPFVQSRGKGELKMGSLLDKASKKAIAGRQMSEANASQRVLAIIVQTTTIELFSSYGIAAAPIRAAIPPAASTDEYAALIPFRYSGLNGTLSVLTDVKTLTRMRQNLLNSRALADWTRELANQLMGRIKNRLARYNVMLEVGIPNSANRQLLAQYSAGKQTNIEYQFRTLGGWIRVVLAGDFEEPLLTFAGGDATLENGKFILF